MEDLRGHAAYLASKGRFGDTMLVHVHPAELAGIASLVPGGQLTINPETGLPEAFFFLPFLASLFGAASPAAAAGTAAAALPAAAGTAGTAAALAPAAAGTGLLGSIGSGLSALGSGIGSLFGATPAAAAPAAALASAPAQAAAIEAASAPAAVDMVTTGSVAPTTAAITTPSAATSTISGITAPFGAVPEGVTHIAPATAVSPAANATTTISGITPKIGLTTLHPGETTAVAPAVSPAAGKTAAAPIAGGVNADTTSGFGISDLLSPKYMMPMYLASQLLSPLFNKKSGDGKSEEEKQKEAKAFTGSMQLPSGARTASYPSSISPIGVEHNYFPNFRWMDNGGLVRGYANGGIVSLANGGPVDPQQQMPQDMTFPMQGVDQGNDPTQIPTSDLPTSQIGEAPASQGQGLQSQPQQQMPSDAEHQLIQEAVMAIKGQVPKPQADQILMTFVQQFGEPALQDLVVRVQQTAQAQQGQAMQASDGQSDSIPATIGGQQPAALSEGEYVVPSDVVSGLGNGSTDAGARHLDRMVDSTRKARHGSPQQPPRLRLGVASLPPSQGTQGYQAGGMVRLGPDYNLDTQDYSGRGDLAIEKYPGQLPYPGDIPKERLDTGDNIPPEAYVMPEEAPWGLGWLNDLINGKRVPDLPEQKIPKSDTKKTYENNVYPNYVWGFSKRTHMIPGTYAEGGIVSLSDEKLKKLLEQEANPRLGDLFEAGMMRPVPIMPEIIPGSIALGLSSEPVGHAMGVDAAVDPNRRDFAKGGQVGGLASLMNALKTKSARARTGGSGAARLRAMPMPYPVQARPTMAEPARLARVKGMKKGGEVDLPDTVYVVPTPRPDDEMTSIMFPAGGLESRSRMEPVYRDYTIPLDTPRFRQAYGDQWVENMKHYQDALHSIDARRRGLSYEDIQRLPGFNFPQ